MFFTVSMIAIIWLNLLHCIASDKNDTFHLLNLDTGDEIFTNNTYSGISDNFDTLDYNNFEPLFGSEFPSDPSQFIDFAQLSEIEDISSKESKREADQITDTSYPGFSHSYDFIGHTNLESSLGSDMDSYRNVWREGNGEIKTNDDKVPHLSIRDAENKTFSPLNLNSDDIVTYMHFPDSQQNAIPIYFQQLTLSSDDTSGQHGAAEQSNIDNILDHRGNTDGESKTDKRNYSCHYRGKKNVLQNHNKYYGAHHKRSFECLYPGCTMTTKSLNEYRAHGKTHGQPFIYECKVPGCGRTYDIVASLYSHKRTHEPHPSCECCGKFFATRKLLNCHKKLCPTTLREQSYECHYPGCAVIAKGYNEYLAHRKTHGQPFIYECKVPGCGQTFDYIPSFCAHKQTHQTHLQCAYCGKLFSSVTTLKSHKKLCSRAPR
ncbi:hypothetical protein QQG55_27065 [Brugia pahangi]